MYAVFIYARGSLARPHTHTRASARSYRTMTQPPAHFYRLSADARFAAVSFPRCTVSLPVFKRYWHGNVPPPWPSRRAGAGVVAVISSRIV